MKNKKRMLIYQFIIIVMFLIVTGSCKKDNSPIIVTPVDKDGYVYKTINIGTQVWMSENLKTTKYSDGTLIGTTFPDTLDITSEIAPKYQWAYMGDESKVATYGRLYTWYAVTDSRNICPTGWHIPSDAEWTTLTTFIGGDTICGGKLKDIGTSYWQSPNWGATNEIGFTALPGGCRYSIGNFSSVGQYGNYWSATDADLISAWYRGLLYNGSDMYKSHTNKQKGFSVRCLKD